ncbi:hypothetical protein M0R45_029216 [Rubus argutus]|uniref:Uncharacterized protein n=1 Tax=Rubus argutus TaxID=59490 RepID=A0AAW1WA44_RUBAR
MQSSQQLQISKPVLCFSHPQQLQFSPISSGHHHPIINPPLSPPPPMMPITTMCTQFKPCHHHCRTRLQSPHHYGHSIHHDRTHPSPPHFHAQFNLSQTTVHTQLRPGFQLSSASSSSTQLTHRPHSCKPGFTTPLLLQNPEATGVDAPVKPMRHHRQAQATMAFNFSPSLLL